LASQVSFIGIRDPGKHMGVIHTLPASADDTVRILAIDSNEGMVAHAPPLTRVDLKRDDWGEVVAEQKDANPDPVDGWMCVVFSSVVPSCPRLLMRALSHVFGFAFFLCCRAHSDIARTVTSPWCAPHVIVRMGGQVDAAVGFSKAQAAIREFETKYGRPWQSMRGSQRAACLNAARDGIRDVYREAWNQPYVRYVCSTPHMPPSPRCLCWHVRAHATHTPTHMPCLVLFVPGCVRPCGACVCDACVTWWFRT